MGAAPEMGRRVRAGRALLLGLCLVLAARPATWYVTVTGLGGEPDYELRFKSQAAEIERALRGVPDARIEMLVSGTREQVRSALEHIGREAAPADALVLMLIGHGGFDGDEYKMNLPGPDLTAAELASLLDRVKAARQLVVNMTSASGGSIEALRRPGRIVITATKSGTEKNATVFARYWIEALSDPAADTDKNEVVSALEAFRYADRKTAEFYETQKRLATEHPLIEDTGKGDGVRAPSSENREGLLAASFPVVRLGRTAQSAADPARQALLARREQLEGDIARLKYQKAAMPAADYKKQLAALLLELAKTQEALDK